MPVPLVLKLSCPDLAARWPRPAGIAVNQDAGTLPRVIPQPDAAAELISAALPMRMCWAGR